MISGFALTSYGTGTSFVTNRSTVKCIEKYQRPDSLPAIAKQGELSKMSAWHFSELFNDTLHGIRHFFGDKSFCR
jgi:hypothetical protein